MEEQLKKFIDCSKEKTMINNILAATVKFGIIPRKEFDSVKELIYEAFNEMVSESTDDYVSDAIYNLLIAAMKAYRSEMKDFFINYLEKNVKNEKIARRGHIINLTIKYLLICAKNNQLPQEETLLEFYDIVFNVAKLFLTNKQNPIVFNENVRAKQLCKLALLSHKFTDAQDLKIFCDYIYVVGKGLTSVGLIFFKNNPDFYPQIVPKCECRIYDILLFGMDAAIKIIRESPYTVICGFFASMDGNEKYSISLEVVRRLAFFERVKKSNDVNYNLFQALLSKVQIKDLNSEIIEIMKREKIVLSNEVVSTITNLKENAHLLPIIGSLEPIDDELIEQYIREVKEQKLILELLRKHPRVELLSNIDIWIDIAKNIEENIFNCRSIIIESIPEIENKVPYIISELSPLISMKLLNGLILEDCTLLVKFLRIPQYMELLRISPISLPKKIVKLIDIQSVFNKYDENTPAPLFDLLSRTDIVPESFKLPPLPAVSGEDVKYSLNANNKGFVVKGNNLIMIDAISRLIRLFKIFNQRIEITENNNIFVFLIFYFRNKNWHEYIDKDVFNHKHKTISNLVFNIHPNSETEEVILATLISSIGKKLKRTEFESFITFYCNIFDHNFYKNSSIIKKTIASELEKMCICKYKGIYEHIFAICYEKILEMFLDIKYTPSRECWSFIYIELCNNNYDFECSCYTWSNYVKELMLKNQEIDEKVTESPLKTPPKKQPEIEEPNKNDKVSKDPLIVNLNFDEIEDDLAFYNEQELREKYSISKLKFIIKNTKISDIDIPERIVRVLMYDDETNAHFLQFMLRKVDNPLTLSLKSNPFGKYLPKMRNALGIAIDSLYQRSLTDKDILIQRVNPIEIPPPSEYSINLVNSLLDFCKEEKSFNSFEILFFIASIFLPVFKYTKMSIRDIFELCISTNYYEDKDLCPLIAATAFLNELLEQPQYLDEFFVWAFENMNNFDKNALLIVITIILLRICTTKTSYITLALLLKYNWKEMFSRIIDKDWNHTDIINYTASDITSCYVTCLLSIDSRAKSIITSLIKSEKLFATKFANLPMESLFNSLRIIGLEMGELFNSYLLFNNRVKTGCNMPFDNSFTFKETPVQFNEHYPELVDKEVLENLDEYTKALYLRHLVYKQEITPTFVSFASKYEPWILNTVENKESMLLSSSHYMKILNIFQEASETKEEKELDIDYEDIRFLIKKQLEDKTSVRRFISFFGSESRKLILIQVLDILIEQSSINFKDSFWKILEIMKTVISSESNCSVISERVSDIIENVLAHINECSVDELIDLINSLASIGVFPMESTEILIGICLMKGTKLQKAAISLFNKLNNDVKEKCRYLLTNMYQKCIISHNYLILEYLLERVPEEAGKFSHELLSLAEDFAKESVENNRISKLFSLILNVFGPDTDNIQAFSLPNSFISQNSSYYNLLTSILPLINRDLENNYSLIGDKYRFMQAFKPLTSFNIRKNIFFKGVIINVEYKFSFCMDRENILYKTLNIFNDVTNDIYKMSLNVTFDREVGVDVGGPTKEWFRCFTKELFNQEKHLFEMMPNQITFKPAKESSKIIEQNQNNKYFITAGKIIASSILRNIVVIAPISHCILKRILCQEITENDVRFDLGEVYDNLISIRTCDDIDSLYLNFTWQVETDGKKHSVELKKGGNDIMVTKENVDEYIKLAVDYMTYRDAQKQIDDFISGFHEIISGESIRNMFSLDELDSLLNGLHDIDINDMEENTVIENPYTRNSKTVKDLFNILRKWSNEDRRKFMTFLTGSSSPPFGGFKNLKMPISISYLSNSKLLPKARTCFNTLVLPDYSNKKILEEKLRIAIENCDTFEEY